MMNLTADEIMVIIEKNLNEVIKNFNEVFVNELESKTDEENQKFYEERIKLAHKREMLEDLKVNIRVADFRKAYPNGRPEEEDEEYEY